MKLMFSSPFLRHTRRNIPARQGVIGRIAPGACTKSESDPAARMAPDSRRDDGRRQTFRIVGEDEADPRGGSIAYVSPLAHRLIGKRVGEAVGMAGREIEIVAIE